MERMTIRGHDRAFDSGGDCRAAEDHKAAGTENDRAAAYPGVEDREGMEGEQGVSGSVPAKRDGVMMGEKEAVFTASFPLYSAFPIFRIRWMQFALDGLGFSLCAAHFKMSIYVTGNDCQRYPLGG